MTTTPMVATATRRLVIRAIRSMAAAVYVVQPGDTLAWIAQVNGVSVYELIAVNNIANPDLIYVGQHLVTARLRRT